MDSYGGGKIGILIEPVYARRIKGHCPGIIEVIENDDAKA